MTTLSPMKSLFYNELFYKLISETSFDSARIIVPLVLDLLNPKSVVDVGCGVAAWLAVFKGHGIDDVLGIDGEYVKKEDLMIPQEKYLSCDLSTGSLQLNRKFDLAISLEVAQYLPAENSERFIASLTSLAPAVLFSSAVPFQGGPLQVNEKWHHEWAELFRKQGYEPVDCIRRKIWNNKNIALWYAQNMILYIDGDHLEKLQQLKKEYTPASTEQLSMIHPDLWNSKMDFLYGSLKKKGLKNRIKNTLRKIVFHDEYTN
jgi:SAM-dependent methyltransferase